MRIIITGGGTGGHVYPALSVCERIKSAIPDVEILYVGSKYGIENNILKNYRFKYQSIDVRGFDRRNIFRMIKAFFILFIGFFQSLKIMKKFKPDLVIGMGGYVSGPVVLSASLFGVDTIIHEQNAVPGFTTSQLAKIATRVLISYKSSAKFFKDDNKIFYSGNPVRRDFVDISREEARKKMNLKKNQKLILSVGGSGGATVINEEALKIAKYIKDIKNVKLIHITGKREYDSFNESISKLDIGDNVEILEYTNQMPLIMNASDIVISRAGAISLAEIATVGVPAILIPSPNVANDHQRKNSEVFDAAGCCIVIDEKNMNSSSVVDALSDLLEDGNRLNIMKNSYQGLTKENALDTIVSIVYDYYLK